MMFNSQAARHPAQALALNSQYIPPPYDLYHHDPSPGPWNPVYATREEYPYGFPASSPSTGQVCFPPPEPNVIGGGGGGSGNSFSPYSFISGQDPFMSRRRPPSESHRASLSVGKTRTTDKYRVVYTDQQRLELEREFQCNRYITMRRKSELSLGLGLSERQVKIWFQNRRAKERKMNRKKLQHSQQASTTTPTPPVLAGPPDAHIATSPSRHILSDTISEEY